MNVTTYAAVNKETDQVVGKLIMLGYEKPRKFDNLTLGTVTEEDEDTMLKIEPIFLSTAKGYIDQLDHFSVDDNIHLYTGDVTPDYTKRG